MKSRQMWRMLEVTEKVLDEMVKIIVETVDPERIILFGSRAREAAGPNSDVDFMVIQSEPTNGRDEQMKLYLALGRFAVAKDIVVFSRDEVEYWRDSINHVISRALREGKVLYERP